VRADPRQGGQPATRTRRAGTGKWRISTGSIAQWVRPRTSNPKVPGSNPGGGSFTGSSHAPPATTPTCSAAKRGRATGTLPTRRASQWAPAERECSHWHAAHPCAPRGSPASGQRLSGRRATGGGRSVTARSGKGWPRNAQPPSRRPPSARHRSGAPHTGRRRGQGRPRTGRPLPAGARLPNRGWDAAQRGGSSTTRMGPPPPSWELRHSEPSQRWSYLVLTGRLFKFLFCFLLGK